jgi:hypothetical protein
MDHASDRPGLPRRRAQSLAHASDVPGHIALPRDASIRRTWRWKLTARGIQIEDKKEIKKRLGRSPDDGDAIVMCLSEGAKAAAAQIRQERQVFICCPPFASPS